ncbi:hypothetical protein ACCS96_50820, partial [Rhizobium ruizarguesonis]
HVVCNIIRVDEALVTGGFKNLPVAIQSVQRPLRVSNRRAKDAVALSHKREAVTVFARGSNSGL